jgi:hypothetical protein
MMDSLKEIGMELHLAENLENTWERSKESMTVQLKVTTTAHWKEGGKAETMARL